MKLRIVDFLLRRCTCWFVFVVGKRTVALGNKEEGLKAGCLLAYMVHEAHQVCLWWQVTDPYGVAFVSNQQQVRS